MKTTACAASTSVVRHHRIGHSTPMLTVPSPCQLAAEETTRRFSSKHEHRVELGVLGHLPAEQRVDASLSGRPETGASRSARRAGLLDERDEVVPPHDGVKGRRAPARPRRSACCAGHRERGDHLVALSEQLDVGVVLLGSE